MNALNVWRVVRVFPKYGPLLVFAACSDGQSSPLPYSPGDITIIGQNLEVKETDIDSCGDECRMVESDCGANAAADVVLDEQGEVADILCYREHANVVEVGVDTVESAEAGNDTVLVLDDVTDGLDVSGVVTLKGNNAVLWGHGAAVSQIGALSVTKNNAIVRGVRVRGDVAITKNNASLSFCEIDGDLTITGNNATVAECVVHGKVLINGVNTVLVSNHFTQATALRGKNLTCNGNFTHEAPDAGGSGDAITCENSNADLAPQTDVDVEAPEPESDAGLNDAL